MKRSKEDQPEIPKVTRALPIVRWTEVFKDYLHRVLGTRKILLAYVTRPDVAVPPLGDQQDRQPFSAGYDSIESDLIARASHEHAWVGNWVGKKKISSTG